MLHLNILARRVALVLLTLATGLTLAPPATAGEYRAFACRLPTGQFIPLGDWTMEHSAVGPGTDLCTSQGYVQAQLGPAQTGVGYFSGIGITMPTGLKATSIRVDRWVRTAAPDNPDTDAGPAYHLRWGASGRWFGSGTKAEEPCETGPPAVASAGRGTSPPSPNVAVRLPRRRGVRRVRGRVPSARSSGGACTVSPRAAGRGFA